jgi:hypothetical protein
MNIDVENLAALEKALEEFYSPPQGSARGERKKLRWGYAR